MRRFYFALFALLSLVSVFATRPLVAATYYVGACKGGAYFTTIHDAVTAATAGSTIDICPGTYAEQVIINKALTLQGILNNNTSQVVIAMPVNQLSTTSSINSQLLASTIAAQIEVTAGPVNISNITVDGTAGAANCPTATSYVGIFYSSGSSGTVNEVETRNQNCTYSSGMGINVENGAGAVESVTIENSNIHDNNYVGIMTCSDQTPSTLTASIKGNYITGTSNGVVTYCNAGGSISGNFIASPNSYPVYAGSSSTAVSGNTVDGGSAGIEVDAAAVVSGNTVSNASVGIYVTVPGSITSNRIVNSPTGIYLTVSGTTVKSNAITKANVGIEFNCHTETVTGNTVNGAAIGIDQVPSVFGGVNKFYSVPTVRANGSC